VVSRAAGPVEGLSPSRAGPAAASSSLRVVPEQLRIPSVGVRAALVPLGVDQTGKLGVPGDPAKAGWYVGSSTPGDLGPSVVAGHVDSARGPAVFARLGSLRPGAHVEVVRSDGRTARFRVLEVQRYPKNRFPTERVYGPTPDRTLRLITCGGVYDRGAGGYRDNVVVYAVSIRS
jgi:sortase (surface protein transpeptidase)